MTPATPHEVGGPYLGNMSCRPTATIVHPSNDPARQLVPALRARLRGRRSRRPPSPQARLRALGLPAHAIPSDPVLARLRAEAIADAVAILLDLPPVIPTGPDGALPDTTTLEDPMLGFALLARRSGPVWLGHRTPSLEITDAGGTVTILVLAPVRDRVRAAVEAPGWAGRVLERAIALEADR